MFKAKNLPHIGERQSLPGTDGTATTIQTDDSVAAPRQPATGRLMSLDALRGFDMIWIIGAQEIVKGLAKVFPGKLSEMAVAQLEHVRWQGLHCYDVIWPLFMFMVGVSLSFSLARRKSSGATDKSLYLHALKRALILFVLGMMAQGNLLQFNLATLHPCYSVLHGIAAGYLIATVVMLRFRPKGQAIVTAVFLILYWILLISIPVPGVGTGRIDPYRKCSNVHRPPGPGKIRVWREYLVSELPGICCFGLDRRLGRQRASLGPLSKEQVFVPVRWRDSSRGSGAYLEPLVSNH